jgi:hypothetical protein
LNAGSNRDFASGIAKSEVRAKGTEEKEKRREGNVD